MNQKAEPFEKVVDNLYTKSNSKSEIVFEPYFTNDLGRSILFDIFRNTLSMIKEQCLNILQKAKNDHYNTSVGDYITRLNDLFVN